MKTASIEKLFGIVNEGIDKLSRDKMVNIVWQGHNGTLSWPFTDENMHLLRQYRNEVSGSAHYLVDAALRWKRRPQFTTTTEHGQGTVLSITLARGGSICVCANDEGVSIVLYPEDTEAFDSIGELYATWGELNPGQDG